MNVNKLFGAQKQHISKYTRSQESDKWQERWLIQGMLLKIALFRCLMETDCVSSIQRGGFVSLKISHIKVGFYQVTGVKQGHLGRVVWPWADCLRLFSPKHLLTHSSKSDRTFIWMTFGSLPKHAVHLKIDVSLAQCLPSLLRALQTDWMMQYTKRAVYIYH